MIANGLDVLGVLLLGAVGVLAVGQDLEIPLVQLVLVADVRYLVPLVAGVGVLFLLKTLFALFISRHAVLYLASIESSYSMRIIEKIFMGGLSRMRRHSRAETEWAVLRSSGVAFTTVLGQAITLVSETALAIGILAVLILADAPAAFALLSYLLVLGLALQLWSSKLVKDAGEQYSNESVATNHALDDLVAAYREIAIAGKLPTFTRSVATHRGAVAVAQANYSFVTSVPRYVAELGLVLGIIGLAAFFAVRDGPAEGLGLLAVFAAGGLRILTAMLPLLRAFQDLRYHGQLASSAQEILAGVRDAGETPRPGEDIRLPPSEFESSIGVTRPPLDVEVRAVSFRHHDRAGSNEAVDHVSLDIRSGEITALAGPSGAGKSSLAELILGLHVPSTGHVRLGGVPADRFRISYPGSIGYVAQKPGLISGSIERNIVLGDKDEQTNWVSLIEAIEIADLGSLIESLPDGFQTDLGKHRDSLSGGQLQRIGLARALYRKPRLLILDEATSALDAESESLVTKRILGLRGQVTVIVIAHRLSSIKEVDRIYLMDNGKVVATGTFAKLYESTPIMRKYAELLRIDPPENS